MLGGLVRTLSSWASMGTRNTTLSLSDIVVPRELPPTIRASKSGQVPVRRTWNNETHHTEAFPFSG